jgi:hypothetical protein
LLLAPLGLALLPVGVVLEKTLKDEIVIKKNLEEKQMVKRTLYPGGSQNGFLYFRIDRRDELAGVHGVRLALKNVRTNQLLLVTVAIRNE